ncbi:hypothetical protein ACT18_17995 [Mycolicibacter kumamotonensis]|jgi:acyl-CoA synthetase (AMP-forming)/AMP-acid ligase II|uniref:Uncharacterized protein n=1 Tax=Mycolicibacter kumamotonensis TaxID=354243 RepID=A0A1B8SCH6_9MYCO|nr:hypothetical protein ACT18_17995 [Mycolicibacter kumamotonensis]
MEMTIGVSLAATVARAVVDVVIRSALEPCRAVGGRGEVGHWIASGGDRAPRRTAEALDAEDWMHTGDLVVMDDGGHLRIAGRIEDMVIRGEENVYPCEVEEFATPIPTRSPAIYASSTSFR